MIQERLPENEADSASSRPRYILSWKVNLGLFSMLVLVVLGVFLWQHRAISSGFRSQALSHSQMVAGLIEENMHNSLLASQVIDEALSKFLLNSAQFIHYLDTIEPFQEVELESFARESGLAGITIIRSDSEATGPTGWLNGKLDCSSPGQTVNYFPKTGQATLVYESKPSHSDGPSCIVVGIDVHRVQEFREKSSLTTLLSHLSTFPGIGYVQIDTDSQTTGTDVQLIQGKKGLIAETHLATQAGILVVGLKTEQYSKRVDELRKQFFLFGILLIILGAGSSWLLYYYQRTDINRTRQFERTLAKQNQEAAMGRATATIAHEIRNPLNAMNIGLQRLVLESDNLSSEQEELLGSMRESVKRTENIIARLQRFTRPLSLEEETVQLDILLRHAVNVYEPVCRQQRILTEFNIDSSIIVNGDPDLLGEMLDNLIKNCVEAQTDGGFLTVTLFSEDDRAVLQVENGGFSQSEETISKITNPYYTTKTRGTGLGLTLVKRIIDLHDGELTIKKGKKKNSLFTQISLARS